MNKKAKFGDIVIDNVIYLVLLIIFFVGMLAFANSKANGASVWEDYYAKEISKVIDSSSSGDNFVIDVHKATEIAKKNKLDSFEEIFSFDNFKNEVCVKLSRGRASCYNYLNEVNVAVSGDKWIYLAEPVDGESVNRLHFSILDGGTDES